MFGVYGFRFSGVGFRVLSSNESAGSHDQVSGCGLKCRVQGLYRQAQEVWEVSGSWFVAGGVGVRVWGTMVWDSSWVFRVSDIEVWTQDLENWKRAWESSFGFRFRAFRCG